MAECKYSANGEACKTETVAFAESEIGEKIEIIRDGNFVAVNNVRDSLFGVTAPRLFDPYRQDYFVGQNFYLTTIVGSLTSVRVQDQDGCWRSTGDTWDHDQSAAILPLLEPKDLPVAGPQVGSKIWFYNFRSGLIGDGSKVTDAFVYVENPWEPTELNDIDYDSPNPEYDLSMSFHYSDPDADDFNAFLTWLDNLSFSDLKYRSIYFLNEQKRYFHIKDLFHFEFPDLVTPAMAIPSEPIVSYEGDLFTATKILWRCPGFDTKDWKIDSSQCIPDPTVENLFVYTDESKQHAAIDPMVLWGADKNHQPVKVGDGFEGTAVKGPADLPEGAEKFVGFIDMAAIESSFDDAGNWVPGYRLSEAFMQKLGGAEMGLTGATFTWTDKGNVYEIFSCADRQDDGMGGYVPVHPDVEKICAQGGTLEKYHVIPVKLSAAQ